MSCSGTLNILTNKLVIKKLKKLNYCNYHDCGYKKSHLSLNRVK